MLATRVGAGIAAEIGSMVVTEQTDALRMCAADPIDFLMVPALHRERGHDGTVLIVWRRRWRSARAWSPHTSFFDVPPAPSSTSACSTSATSIGLAKMHRLRRAIPIVSGYCGLRTFGGSEGVGWATTRAVVNSSLFGIIIWQFILSAVGYELFPPDPMSIIFENIHKAFGPKVILNGVDLEIGRASASSSSAARASARACSSSTSSACCYPDDGNIYLGSRRPERRSQPKRDRDVPRAQRCAMVFQNSTLFDSMNVRGERGPAAAQAQEPLHEGGALQAMVQLIKVHMQDFAKSYPAELGDGMRKRVAIARALTLDPEYVLFDEPTTSLDPISARRVDAMIRELCDVVGVTSIVVSHDLVSIESISDRIAMLYKGTVRLLGSQADFQACEDGVVHQFIRGHAEGPMEM
jgi:phospholipid/cholesterol/gamma-HCH transport system ATP-binding protein